MSSAAAVRAPHRASGRWPVRLHSPQWPGLLALLALLAGVALLLAFHQVVRGAVEQSEQRRLAITAHATATWRCNAMTGVGLSEGCLARLNAGARDEAALLSRGAER